MKDLGKLRSVGPGGESEEMDGRRRRSQDSRARIVAAMLDLVREGDVSPGAEIVAARAEVGLRTVFRHFKDMDSLYGEMSHAIEGELTSVAARPLLSETAHERVLELVERRSEGFEKIAPFKREILQRLAPPEVAADPTKIEALDLLLSFEAWQRLRREQGLTPAQAREVLAAAVTRILADSEAA